MNQMTLKSFDDRLARDMHDPEFAVAYLEDALDESLEEFLVALGLYVKAHGGITQCAERAGLTREALYRMLSKGGNPELRSVQAILRAHGMQLTIKRCVKEEAEAPELAAA